MKWTRLHTNVAGAQRVGSRIVLLWNTTMVLSARMRRAGLQCRLTAGNLQCHRTNSDAAFTGRAMVSHQVWVEVPCYARKWDLAPGPNADSSVLRRLKPKCVAGKTMNVSRHADVGAKKGNGAKVSVTLNAAKAKRNQTMTKQCRFRSQSERHLSCLHTRKNISGKSQPPIAAQRTIVTPRRLDTAESRNTWSNFEEIMTHFLFVIHKKRGEMEVLAESNKTENSSGLVGRGIKGSWVCWEIVGANCKNRPVQQWLAFPTR